MTKEADVIQHLLEVEREASVLVMDAQKRSDEKINEARAKADEKFLSEYSSIVSEIDSAEKEKIDSMSREHDSKLSDYRDSLNGTRKDFDAFSSVLDQFLS